MESPPSDTSFLYRLYGTTVECAAPLESHIPHTSGSPGLHVVPMSSSSSEKWWGAATQTHAEPGSADAIGYFVHTHPRDERLAFQFDPIVDFGVGPEIITYQLHDPRRAYGLEIWLLGAVLSTWNEQHGRPALHASAVQVGNRAVGFLASKEGGKSSLAAAFVKEGHPLLTDDVLIIESSELGVVGRPSYPQMRLWPEQARHFTGTVKSYDRVVPHLDKRRVPVGAAGFGTYQGATLPISLLFLPQRRTDVSEPHLEPIEPSRRLIELVRHSFLPNTVDHLGLSPRRLPVLSTLAEQAEMYRLIYPEGFNKLSAVVEAVRGNMLHS